MNRIAGYIPAIFIFKTLPPSQLKIQIFSKLTHRGAKIKFVISKIFTIFAEKYEVMETIINFLNTYSIIIVLSIIALLLICAFICCITQVAAKIAVFLGACGCIGIALTLGFIAFLLIIEFKEVCSK